MSQPRWKSQATSFAQVEGVSTPTMSNRGCPTPTEMPPPLLLGEPSRSNDGEEGVKNMRLQQDRQQQQISSMRLVPEQNGHASHKGKPLETKALSSAAAAGTTPRKPRFSSLTAAPIIVQRPFSMLQSPLVPSNDQGESPSKMLKARSNNSTSHAVSATEDFSLSSSRWKATVATTDLSKQLVKYQDMDILFLLAFLASDLWKASPSFEVFLDQLEKLVATSRHCLRSMSEILFANRFLGITKSPSPPSIIIMSTEATSVPSSSSASLRLEIRGIPNYGQTCFMNSVLQSLASLEPFVAYLERIVQVKEDTPSQPSDSDEPIGEEDSPKKPQQDPKSTPWFSRQLLGLLSEINCQENLKIVNNHRQASSSMYQRVDPRNLLRQIGETNSQFRCTRFMEQQDAQELLQALLGVVIVEAQLDSPQAFSHLDIDEEESLTAVVAGDEIRNQYQQQQQQQHHVDWSPTSSVVDGCVVARDSVTSLSSLLYRIDAEQRNLTGIRLQRATLKGKDMDNTNAEIKDAAARSDTTSPTMASSVDECNNQREEKKQEDFEISIPIIITEDDSSMIDRPDGQQSDSSCQTPEHERADDSTISEHSVVGTDSRTLNTHPGTQLSTSMRVMRSTISSITPSPLSGWLGSTLRCCKCKHVRPIVNAPFLDIPVVPTSVPLYLSKAQTQPGVASPASSALPACTLEQCLADFTSVERIQGVECRSCTIGQEIEKLEEEAMMLEGAIAAVLKRLSQKGDNSTDEVKYLRNDLETVELRLMELRSMDPDTEDPSLLESEPLKDEDLLLGLTLPKKAKSLERCDAKKCLLLTRCPAVLCCHVQRRYFNPYSNRMEKCIQFVEFPEVLDLGPYCAYGPRAHTPWVAGSMTNSQRRDQNPEINSAGMHYRLQSIIEHRGNAHGGHYISYRRDHTGEWFRISDDNVTAIPWRQVRTCQAYMLFYEAT